MLAAWLCPDGAKPSLLHVTAAAAITTPVARIFLIVVVRRPSLLRRHLDASGERQHDEHGGETPILLHCAMIGPIRLGSLFLTLPTER